MGKKTEKYRKRVSAEWVYIGFYQWNHQRKLSICIPVGDSASDCATSLYGDPGLNPSVIPLVKSPEKNTRHHTVATFQKNYLIRRRYCRYIPTDVFRRYIPTVSPTGIICRYISTELKTELFPSIRITDEKIPLVFADFLVVRQLVFAFFYKKIWVSEPVCAYFD